MGVLTAGQSLQQALSLRAHKVEEMASLIRELPLVQISELRAKEAAFMQSSGAGEAISTTRERQWVAAVDFTAERYKMEADIKALQVEIDHLDKFIEITKYLNT